MLPGFRRFKPCLERIAQTDHHSGDKIGTMRHETNQLLRHPDVVLMAPSLATVSSISAAGSAIGIRALHELDEHVPKHRLTDRFSDRVHRLYNVVNVK